MVRLGDQAKTLKSMSDALFQFQYGAIRRITGTRLISNIAQFQFQYGAIRSGTQEATVVGKIQFQFQYGAIRSCDVKGQKSHSNGFNSSMVRLGGENKHIL